MKKVIGYLIIASPFVAIFLVCGFTLGFLPTVFIFFVTGGWIALIHFGVSLISDNED